MQADGVGEDIVTTGDFNQEEEGGLAVEGQTQVEGQEREDALEF